MNYRLGLLAVCFFMISCRQESSQQTMVGTPLTSPTYVDTPDGMTEAKPIEVKQLVNAQEILPNLISISGLGSSSDKVYSDFQSWRTLYSESGEPDSINAPLWLGIVNISGSVCVDLLSQEKLQAAANRRFFNQVDFSKAPSALTDAAISDVIRKFARSAWARNETAGEASMIKQAIGVFNGTTKDQTDLAMLTICTSMFAALETNVK